MLNKEQLSKLSNNELLERLGKPRNAYNEDILMLCEAVKRLLPGKTAKVENLVISEEEAVVSGEEKTKKKGRPKSE